MARAFDDFTPAQLDPYGERFKQGHDLVAKKIRPPHGGCVGCPELNTASVAMCKRCCFYKFDWSLLDMNPVGPYGARNVLSFNWKPSRHGFPEEARPNDAFVNCEDDQMYLFTDYKGRYRWTVVAGMGTASTGLR